ncbi:hypothetical protein [Salinactinospora qingdaonensis]|uniref:Uncharacterized protein n=1 Tax=Salinactinospora qingdaonensis TaxID=702744 RepID=A0ABP7FDH9_9ACTN
MFAIGSAANFAGLLTAVPMLLVAVIGAVVARTSRHPRKGMITTAMVFLALATLAEAGWLVALPALYTEWGVRPLLLSAVNLVILALGVLAWILVLVALLRRPHPGDPAASPYGGFPTPPPPGAPPQGGPYQPGPPPAGPPHP